MKKRLIALLLLAVLLLPTVACDRGQTPADTSPDTTAPEATAEPTAPSETDPATDPETTAPETSEPDITEPTIDHFEFAEGVNPENVEIDEVFKNLISFSTDEISVDSIFDLFKNDDIAIADANGESVTDGNIGTGYTITSTVSGVSKTISAVIIGDINGDGISATSADRLTIVESFTGRVSLDAPYAAAADCNSDGSLTSSDILLMTLQLKGEA